MCHNIILTVPICHTLSQSWLNVQYMMVQFNHVTGKKKKKKRLFEIENAPETLAS